MAEAEEERYLGDIISKDGRNIKNFKARVKKGTGIVNKIMTMLEGIPFGKFYFEVAVILRNSLLVSSILCNSEAWYNITNAEMDFLETVDLVLLRRILGAPNSTPKEMLYLELGCIPLRNVIQKRRLSFLYYILHEDPKSLVFKFLESPMKNRTKNDWASTVLKDIQELSLNLKIEDINVMKNMLKQRVIEKTLQDLNGRKKSHSKVMSLEHKYLKMKKYFMPKNIQTSKEEIQCVFKLRCRVTNVKTNMQGLYDSFECTACGKNDESQKHIIECKELLKRNQEIREKTIYENLFQANVSEQIHVAKMFIKNMKIKEEMMKNEK